MNLGQDSGDKETRKAAPVATKNPYIVNFCKVLVEKKGEKLEPDALKKLLDDMYRLYENMLGQNMVKALPDAVRQKYLDLCEDLTQLDYETIGETFDKHIPDYEGVMKQTMQQFAEIFMRNRTFNPKDYPVQSESNEDGNVAEAK